MTTMPTIEEMAAVFAEAGDADPIYNNMARARRIAARTCADGSCSERLTDAIAAELDLAQIQAVDAAVARLNLGHQSVAVIELTAALDKLLNSLPPDFDRAYYDEVTALHGVRKPPMKSPSPEYRALLDASDLSHA